VDHIRLHIGGIVVAKVGLIAGIGVLPVEFMRAAHMLGHQVVVIGVVPDTDPILEKEADAFYHISVAKLGKIFKTLKKEGVSDEFLDFADETLAIPMYGFTESFNVSVAAAICMYDFKQKLLKSNIDYFLKDEKLLRTKIRWAVNSIRSGQEILDKYMNEN